MKILTGLKFGRLTVVGFSFMHPVQGARWECVCTCGTKLVVARGNLTTGNSQSCGCLKLEKTRERATTHGETRLGKRRSPEYEIWGQMIQRCRNPKNKNFHNYGGRGIDVCPRWLVFENFLNDMGRRPLESLSIDRRDNDQGYCKSNCRWATDAMQMRNTRRNRRVSTPAGEMLLCEAAALSGLSQQVLWKRMNRHWPADRLFDAPGTYVFSRQGLRPSN